MTPTLGQQEPEGEAYFNRRLAFARKAPGLPSSAQFDLARSPLNEDELEEALAPFGLQDREGWGFPHGLNELLTQDYTRIAVDDIKTLQSNLVREGYAQPGIQPTGTWSPEWYGPFRRFDQDNLEEARRGNHFFSTPPGRAFAFLGNMMPERVFSGVVGIAKGIVTQAPETASRVGALGGALAGAAIGAPIPGGFIPGAIIGAAVGFFADLFTDDEETEAENQSLAAKFWDSLSPYDEYKGDGGHKRFVEDLGFVFTAASMVAGGAGAVAGVRAGAQALGGVMRGGAAIPGRLPGTIAGVTQPTPLFRAAIMRTPVNEPSWFAKLAGQARRGFSGKEKGIATRQWIARNGYMGRVINTYGFKPFHEAFTGAAKAQFGGRIASTLATGPDETPMEREIREADERWADGVKFSHSMILGLGLYPTGLLPSFKGHVKAIDTVLGDGGLRPLFDWASTLPGYPRKNFNRILATLGENDAERAHTWSWMVRQAGVEFEAHKLARTGVDRSLTNVEKRNYKNAKAAVIDRLLRKDPNGKYHEQIVAPIIEQPSRMTAYLIDMARKGDDPISRIADFKQAHREAKVIQDRLRGGTLFGDDVPEAQALYDAIRGKQKLDRLNVGLDKLDTYTRADAMARKGDYERLVHELRAAQKPKKHRDPATGQIVEGVDVGEVARLRQEINNLATDLRDRGIIDERTADLAMQEKPSMRVAKSIEHGSEDLARDIDNLPKEFRDRLEKIGYKAVITGEDLLWPDDTVMGGIARLGDYTKRREFFESLGLGIFRHDDDAIWQYINALERSEVEQALAKHKIKMSGGRAMKLIHNEIVRKQVGSVITKGEAQTAGGIGTKTAKRILDIINQRIDVRDLSPDDIARALDKVDGMDMDVAYSVYDAIKRGAGYGGEGFFQNPFQAASALGRAMRTNGLPGFSDWIRRAHVADPQRMHKVSKYGYRPSQDLARSPERARVDAVLRQVVVPRTNIVVATDQLPIMFLDGVAEQSVLAGRHGSVDDFYRAVDIQYLETITDQQGWLFKKMSGYTTPQQLAAAARSDIGLANKTWYQENRAAILAVPLKGSKSKIGISRRSIGPTVSPEDMDRVVPRGARSIRFADDLRSYTKKNMGATFEMRGPLVGTPREAKRGGYAVKVEQGATVVRPASVLDDSVEFRAALDELYMANRRQIANGDVKVGTWTEEGNVEFDIIEVLDDLETSKVAAAERGEKAVYGFLEDKSFPIKANDRRLASEKLSRRYDGPRREVSDTELLFEIIGGTTMQKAPPENALAALSVLRQWKQGRTVAQMEGLHKTNRAVLHDILENGYTTDMWGAAARAEGKTKHLPAHVQDYLESLEHTRGKVTSFVANLKGDLDRLTDDTWVYRMFDIDTGRFGKVEKAAVRKKMEEVRLILEQETGEPWKMAEVQASLWSAYKHSYADEILRESAGPLKRALAASESGNVGAARTQLNKIRNLHDKPQSKTLKAIYVETRKRLRVELGRRPKPAEVNLAVVDQMAGDSTLISEAMAVFKQASTSARKNEGFAAGFAKPGSVQALDDIAGLDGTGPMFAQRVSQDVRGATKFGPSYSAIVRFARTADIGTLAHEDGHLLRMIMGPEDVAAWEARLGVKGGKWTEANEEAFADTVEAYLRGKIDPNDADFKGLLPLTKQAIGSMWGRMRSHIGNENAAPRQIQRELDKTFADYVPKQVAGLKKRMVMGVASKHTALGVAVGAGQGALYGDEGLEDIARGAVMGGLGGMGLRKALGASYGYLPDYLVRVNTALRYSLSWTFDIGRYTEAAQIAATKYGLTPMVRPVKNLKARTWERSPYTSEAVSGDTAWAHAVALHDEINGGSLMQNVEDFDRRMFQAGVLGFRPRDFEVAYTWQLYQRGWGRERIKEAVSHINRYGPGRTAIEKSANFIFFPFSFSKKLLSTMGEFLTQAPGRNLLLQEGLRRFHESGFDDDLQDFLAKHVPLLETLSQISNLSYGLSPGRFFLQGIKDRRTRTGEVMQALASVFIPSGAATPLAQSAGALGDLNIHAFAPIVLTGESLDRAGNVNNVMDIFNRYIPFVRDIKKYFKAGQQQLTATLEGAAPWEQFREFSDEMRMEKERLGVYATAFGYESVDGFLQSDMGQVFGAKLEAKRRELGEKYPTGFQMSTEFENTTEVDKQALYDITQKVRPKAAELRILALSESAHAWKQVAQAGVLPRELITQIIGKKIRGEAQKYMHDRDFADLYRRFFERDYGPIEMTAR